MVFSNSGGYAYLGLETVVYSLDWGTMQRKEWVAPEGRDVKHETSEAISFVNCNQKLTTRQHCYTCSKLSITHTLDLGYSHKPNSVRTLGSMGMVIVFSQGVETTNTSILLPLEISVCFLASSSGSAIASGTVHPPHQYSVCSEL